MRDLRELYQEVIFDHYKQPRNYHRLENTACKAEGYNPLCGDKVTVYLKVENGVIQDASFEGTGCAISTASASLMTEALKGKTEAEAEELFKEFHDMVTSANPSDHPRLGKLAALSGVREFPARTKCATLVWHTLHAALKKSSAKVSTE